MGKTSSAFMSQNCFTLSDMYVSILSGKKFHIQDYSLIKVTSVLSLDWTVVALKASLDRSGISGFDATEEKITLCWLDQYG